MKLLIVALVLLAACSACTNPLTAPSKVAPNVANPTLHPDKVVWGG